MTSQKYICIDINNNNYTSQYYLILILEILENNIYIYKCQKDSSFKKSFDKIKSFQRDIMVVLSLSKQSISWYIKKFYVSRTIRKRSDVTHYNEDAIIWK